MKKYKALHISPEVHARFKAHAAMAGENMGEYVERIILDHMNSEEPSLLEQVESVKNKVSVVSFIEGADEFVEAAENFIKIVKKR